MANTNATLAAIFQQMADVMEILGEDFFRVNAFKKASRTLADLSDDVRVIGPEIKALTAIPGIGKGTAERISEFLKTGKIVDHETLVAKVPPGLLGMLAIPSMGPKTVALLWKQAGVESVDQLEEKLKSEVLADLPGMGVKKLEAMRKNIAFMKSTAGGSGGRIKLGVAMPLALDIIGQLKAHTGVEHIAYAGSLRRGRETIGDVDILVGGDEALGKKVSGAFVKHERVAKILVEGPTKCSIVTDNGVQVDLRVVPVDRFGAALMYFTGSKEHNIAMRERAIKMGMKLSEWGLFKAEDEKTPIVSATEEEVYKTLGLSYIPPELREARGELALAEKGAVPKLIEVSDIKAELHAHTTASDGTWSIRALAMAAYARGYHTIAVTDHSKSQPIANGLSEERLEAHIQAIHAVAAELKGEINVLAGSEVDILADGTLDYPDSLLKQLDIVVASPHNGLSQDPDKATARLLKAIENPYVTIVGHPTGRLILQREGLSPDMRKLFKAAAARGIAMEINANHYRLDLRDAHARAALEEGVKLAIDTDAHGPGDMDEIPYGILTARRAGARASDVINCMGRDELAAWIKKSRA